MAKHPIQAFFTLEDSMLIPASAPTAHIFYSSLTDFLNYVLSKRVNELVNNNTAQTYSAAWVNHISQVHLRSQGVVGWPEMSPPSQFREALTFILTTKYMFNGDNPCKVMNLNQ